MKGNHPVVLATMALALALAASATHAQTNPPAAGVAKPKSGATISVTVTNRRATTVSELDVAPAGSPAFKPFLRKLGPGKSAVITLPRDDICKFDLYAKYDDGQTSSISGFDPCEDSKVNLVE
jgi:hypothetical protein